MARRSSHWLACGFFLLALLWGLSALIIWQDTSSDGVAHTFAQMAGIAGLLGVILCIVLGLLCWLRRVIALGASCVGAVIMMVLGGVGGSTLLGTHVSRVMCVGVCVIAITVFLMSISALVRSKSGAVGDSAAGHMSEDSGRNAESNPFLS